MKIYSDKLSANLKQSLAPVYLVASDDLLLQAEACDAIRKAAAKQGFKERERSSLEQNFDWMLWTDSCNAMSLFASQRLIELHLNTSKIGTVGSEAISAYVENPSPDSILLIIAPQIKGNPKWLKSVISQGVYVPVYPLDKNRLAPWLIERAKKKKLTLLSDAAVLLGDRVEGNLSAAVQELDKLALLLPENSTVDSSIVSRAVADSARFSAFNMLDKAIDGDAVGVCRALRHLREEGNEPPAIIGAIAHQLRTLFELKEFELKGKLGDGFKSQRIVNKRQPAMANALSRLTPANLRDLTRLASEADIDGKSANKENSWIVMEMIVLTLAGKTLATQQAHLQ